MKIILFECIILFICAKFLEKENVANILFQKIIKNETFEEKIDRKKEKKNSLKEFYIRNNITSYDSKHDDNLLNLRKILISNSSFILKYVIKNDVFFQIFT